MGYDASEGQTCLDGILVCGMPGRGKRQQRLGHYANIVHSASFFTIDVRGELKPDISPARTPPQGIIGGWSRGPRWKRIQWLVDRAQGRLWEDIAAFLEEGLEQREFWKLGSIYNSPFAHMQCGVVWKHVALPLVDAAGKTTWCKLCDLRFASLESTMDGFDLVTADGSRISLDVELANNVAEQYGKNLIFWTKSLAALMGTLAMREEEVRVEFYPPPNGAKTPSEFMLSRGPFFGGYAIPYDVEWEGVVTIQCPFNSVNRKHPLVQVALESEFVEEKDAIQEFASSVVRFFADKDELEKLASNPSGGSYWAKRVGWEYFGVDWSRYDRKLRGPYRVWLKEKGVVEITEDDFNRWAHAEVSR